jgi:hypothetical protein
MPLTGRTHQIRAHLAALGHPIIGDGKYCQNAINKAHKADKQLLWAYRLELSAGQPQNARGTPSSPSPRGSSRGSSLGPPGSHGADPSLEYLYGARFEIDLPAVLAVHSAKGCNLQ